MIETHFSKIHTALGLNKIVTTKELPGCTVGAAPMSPETFSYFQSLDIILHELYGFTECMGPSCANMAGNSTLNLFFAWQYFYTFILNSIF